MTQSSSPDEPSPPQTPESDPKAPTQIGTAPTVDAAALSYAADPQPLPAANGVAKYWVIASSDATRTLYLQWLPLP